MPKFVQTDVLDKAQLAARWSTPRSASSAACTSSSTTPTSPAGFDRFERKPDADLQLAFEGGPLHTYRAMQMVFPHMKEQGWGRIINFVSLNGINAHQYSVDYNAAKLGILAITRTAAREWAKHNILANCIAPAAASPAYVAFAEAAPENAKEMLKENPMGRMGDPEHDIGGVALFLATRGQRLHHRDDDVRRRWEPHQRGAVGPADAGLTAAPMSDGVRRARRTSGSRSPTVSRGR